jgi:hypothetical protein
MPIEAKRQRFTTWQISGAPPAAGVYVLWERDEPIYVGATRGDATIRSMLQDHYARRARPHDASHFSWELSRDPALREAELLVEFRHANARLPRGNERSQE